MEALGRLFNIIPVATGKQISLKNASGVTFVCYEDGGGQAITIEQAVQGSASVALATVTKIYASSGVGSVWTKETTDANGALGTGDAAIVKKDTTAFDAACFYIGADELADGYDSVEVTIDGAGICIAIVHDLAVQRAPENLAAFAA